MNMYSGKSKKAICSRPSSILEKVVMMMTIILYQGIHFFPPNYLQTTSRDVLKPLVLPVTLDVPRSLQILNLYFFKIPSEIE